VLGEDVVAMRVECVLGGVVDIAADGEVTTSVGTPGLATCIETIARSWPDTCRLISETGHASRDSVKPTATGGARIHWGETGKPGRIVDRIMPLM